MSKTKLHLYGDWAFTKAAAAAAALWNPFPLTLRATNNLDLFKKSPKTYLFQGAEETQDTATYKHLRTYIVRIYDTTVLYTSIDVMLCKVMLHYVMLFMFQGRRHTS